MAKYEYDVVSARGYIYDMDDPAEKLVSRVQERLDEGWELKGGVSVSSVDGYMVAAQAIVRKK